ncbi:hypothetical protein [Bacillus massiliglaciei]|uniref:hypothetical protein n=1 Tax=Bacillus massiliglaciei TaxID=1816693 RepID=UPI000DA5F8A4|nr:hypothetical protein [Bacillus massiliglaciei]
MKKFVVELSITQTFTAQVVVEGDFKDKKDPAIDATAKLAADNMDHDNWGYEETEFEILNVTPVLDNLSALHHKVS